MKFFDKKESENTNQPYVPATTGGYTQPSPAPEPPKAPSSPMRPVGQTTLGPNCSIKGDLKCDENLLVQGVVEGSIETTRDVTIGPEGKVRASIRASNVVISGIVIGNVTALNKVDLAPSGQLQGNIRAPKLSIAESALFKGSIDMSPPDPVSDRTEKERKVQPQLQPNP